MRSHSGNDGRYNKHCQSLPQGFLWPTRMKMRDHTISLGKIHVSTLSSHPIIWPGFLYHRKLVEISAYSAQSDLLPQ